MTTEQEVMALISNLRDRAADVLTAMQKRIKRVAATQEGTKLPMQANVETDSVVVAVPILKPKVSSFSTGPRPSDAQIIGVLAGDYGVDERTVIRWLQEMKLDDYIERMRT